MRGLYRREFSTHRPQDREYEVLRRRVEGDVETRTPLKGGYPDGGSGLFFNVRPGPLHEFMCRVQSSEGGALELVVVCGFSCCVPSFSSQQRYGSNESCVRRLGIAVLFGLKNDRPHGEKLKNGGEGFFFFSETAFRGEVSQGRNRRKENDSADVF